LNEIHFDIVRVLIHTGLSLGILWQSSRALGEQQNFHHNSQSLAVFRRFNNRKQNQNPPIIDNHTVCSSFS